MTPNPPNPERPEGALWCDYCYPATKRLIGLPPLPRAHPVWWTEPGGSGATEKRRVWLCQACWRRLEFLHWLVLRARATDWPGRHHVTYHARGLGAPQGPAMASARPEQGGARWPAWVAEAARGERTAGGLGWSVDAERIWRALRRPLDGPDGPGDGRGAA